MKQMNIKQCLVLEVKINLLKRQTMLEFLSGTVNLNQESLKYLFMFSKETLQQYRRRRKDKTINTNEIKRKSQPRGPSLIITSSVLSMFSVSKLSLASDYEEEINCTKHLTVLKILIGDILLSLIDPVTDFMNVRITCNWQNKIMKPLPLGLGSDVWKSTN